VDGLLAALQEVGYFADRRLATAVFLALRLQRPLLLEGEPGVGKTSLAQALSQVLERQLIRLQCYDGLEQREALYEWNYAAQLLHLRAAELRGAAELEAVEQEVYQPRYLVRRPLLQALQAPAPGAVLLIDEVDRADEPFEAFLLEYLGEYQVSIPELGSSGPRCRPSPFSRATARAICMMRSSAAASITGWTTPNASASWPLSRPRCPRPQRP
jgi:MoxR-like ATPase